MGYQITQQYLILVSYLCACVYKIYNAYYISYLTIHVEARDKDKTIEEIKRLKYYQFYTRMLRQESSTLTIWDHFKNGLSRGYKYMLYESELMMPNYSTMITSIMKANFILITVAALKIGYDFKDNQFFNMGFICFFELICEMFIPWVPSWYHRQVLLLDDFIRQIYDSSELWDEKLYQLAFKSV